jgi:hypothetical protein
VTKIAEEHAMLRLEGIKAVFAAEFARIDDRFDQIDDRFAQFEGRMDDRFTQSEAKMEAKIESVAGDQLFKIVALFVSAAAATIGAVVLAINLSR